MYSPKTAAGAVAKPAAEVFATVRRLASEKPYTVTSEDAAAGRIAFSQGKTLFAWGYEFEVSVTPGAAGADLQVTAGGKDGAPRAMLDGKKHEKAAAKFYDAVVAASA